MIPIPHYLTVSAILFTTGVIGVLMRRNALIMLMSLELMLNAVNLSFVAFANRWHNLNGQVFVFFVMVVAAAEAAIPCIHGHNRVVAACQNRGGKRRLACTQHAGSQGRAAVHECDRAGWNAKDGRANCRGEIHGLTEDRRCIGERHGGGYIGLINRERDRKRRTATFCAIQGTPKVVVEIVRKRGNLPEFLTYSGAE